MAGIRRLAIAATVLLTAWPALGQSPAPTLAAAPAVATYQIDPVHSELTFRVRHLLGRVAGTFREWGGTVVIDTVNPSNSKVHVEVKTASIETLKAERDTHLRTGDFFDVARFPAMTFRSTSVTVKDKSIRLAGDLTIRDRTKPVVIEGTYQGRFNDPWGKVRTAFIASTKINRQDFGVAFNAPFEQIGQIGDEVEIAIAIEAVQQ
jgi:polyisoprenoid-binding protein YceI